MPPEAANSRPPKAASTPWSPRALERVRSQSRGDESDLNFPTLCFAFWLFRFCWVITDFEGTLAPGQVEEYEPRPGRSLALSETLSAVSMECGVKPRVSPRRNTLQHLATISLFPSAFGSADCGKCKGKAGKGREESQDRVIRNRSTRNPSDGLLVQTST